MSVNVADADVPELADLRCPGLELPGRDGRHHPGRLLAKVYLGGGQPSYVHPDNLIELPCEECKYWLRKTGRPAHRVLHRYDLAGTLVETLVIDAGPGGS